MTTKIIITGLDLVDKKEVAMKIIEINDDFSLAPTFATRDNDEVQYDYMMDIETVHLSYKNNSLLYVRSEDDLSYGVTTDDYYNSNVCCLHLKDFNMISERMFGDDIVVAWIDTKKKQKSTLRSDMIEASNMETRMEVMPVLYFLDESVDYIAEVLIKYAMETSEEKRQKILEDFS